MTDKGRMIYSKQIKGARGNHRLPVRFDKTDGYIGIRQIENGRVSDRVLLSPAQMRALIKFVEGKV